jgi:hypothetical protein
MAVVDGEIDGIGYHTFSEHASLFFENQSRFGSFARDVEGSSPPSIALKVNVSLEELIVPSSWCWLNADFGVGKIKREQ